MISDKNALRKELREIRKYDSDKKCKDNHICRLFLESNLLFKVDIVFMYYSVSDEVDTSALISELRNKNIVVAFPKCTDNEGNMIFYLVASDDGLIDGMYGIKEPDTSRCTAAVPTENSLCVVPALSFDLQGYRLGYGKGYYDRFLEKFTGASVGLCRENCLRDYLPRNEFDKKVDFLVTEKRIINFNEKEERCDG